MAEEDLLFGKNRHMFGGIAPSNMKKFSPSFSNGKAYIDCQLPDDTVIDGQKLCSVAGAIIRRKTTGYPVDEFDGDFVADIKIDENVLDADAVMGKLYYYSAFPYTTNGVYNRSSKNRALLDFGSIHYIYGYDLNLTDSNPSTRVTYPNDVLNAVFKPAKMNYSTGAFDYGGWTIEPGKQFMPRPCMLSLAGEVLQYLNPNDYTKKYDSTEASNVSNSAISSGNAMMEWPKIYMKREVVDGIYKFRCSDTKVDSDWDCWCNYDASNNQINHFYTGIYPGTGINESTSDSNRLRSISGQTITTHATAGDPYLPSGADDKYVHKYPYEYFMRSAYGNNRSSSYDSYGYPANYGDGWTTELLADRLLIQDLLVMMARTTDCQTAYGMGASENGVTTNGTLDKKGLFWGSNATTSAIKIFGMENWWGNMYRLMEGLYYKMAFERSSGNKIKNKSAVKYKLTAGTHDGTTVNHYITKTYVGTDKNDGYSDPFYLDDSYLNIQAGQDEDIDTYASQGGWIKTLSFVSSHGRISPLVYAGNNVNDDLAGSSTTYETDYAYFNGSPLAGDLFIAYVGYSSTAYGSGPFSLYFADIADDTLPTHSSTCASIAYK